MTEQPSDVVVLGGGSGGYAAAFRAAELGMTVTLIEKDKLGGTCLHRGCIPTKALLHAAEVADSARDGAKFGVKSVFNGVDVAAVHAYKDGVVGRLYKGLQGLAKHHSVNVVAGQGRLVAPDAVEVDGVRYTASKGVVLATGSYSKTLPSLELGGRVLDSEAALALDSVPSNVVVLGGGVIGVEFASVWASFGASVTIVEALDRLVPAEDPFCSKLVERAFRRRKIAFKTGTRFSSATQSADGVSVQLESGETLSADVLLVAVGRGPSTDGLAEAGVALEADGRVGVAGGSTARGFVQVNDRLQTSLPNVWAVGDIVPGLQLAHRGFAHGIFVAEEIASLSPVPVEDAGIPRVTYSHPEVASVGLSEEDARAQYGDVQTLTYDLGGNGKSQILGTSGAVKLVRAPDGPVVGVHMVGDRVGELIGEAQLIYNWEAFPDDVAPLIHAHPTQTEALGEAHMALAGKPLHVHG